MTTFRPASSASACGLVVAHRELHPDHLRLRLERQGFLDDRQHMFGGAKNIDHVDRFGNVGERCVDLLPEDVFAGLSRD